MKAEIPHQTLGELSAPYHQISQLQWAYLMIGIFIRQFIRKK